MLALKPLFKMFSKPEQTINSSIRFAKIPRQTLVPTTVPKFKCMPVSPMLTEMCAVTVTSVGNDRIQEVVRRNLAPEARKPQSVALEQTHVVSVCPKASRSAPFNLSHEHRDISLDLFEAVLKKKVFRESRKWYVANQLKVVRFSLGTQVKRVVSGPLSGPHPSQTQPPKPLSSKMRMRNMTKDLGLGPCPAQRGYNRTSSLIKDDRNEPSAASYVSLWDEFVSPQFMDVFPESTKHLDIAKNLGIVGTMDSAPSGAA